MLNPKKLEEIAKQITESLPPGVKTMAEGMESKVKQVVQSKLAQMDFVSREEFDVQTRVLQRTREKLEALEARMAALEGSETTVEEKMVEVEDATTSEDTKNS
jgi:BMFP domain-containing protein YqiC